jgi:hypothetical protein
MDEPSIEIIFPEKADETDPIEFGLVSLTEAISKVASESVAHGLLGGDFGYGADFENDVFLMHHFCWCESPECPWCAGCYCADNDWRNGEKSPEGEKCDWCAGVHKWADKGALPPNEHPHNGAPNFWHKRSGARVWWYKWIGRGMEIVEPDGVDWPSIFAECAASLPAPPTAE